MIALRLTLLSLSLAACMPLGADGDASLDAYDAAMAAGLYDEVAYATNNPQKFFAELTEAWLWSNDFYPFVRAELSEHDPQGAAMVQSAWGTP